MSCGALCTGWGAGITRSASTPSGEYLFSSNNICYWGMYVLDLALRLVWGVGPAGMVTACISILRGISVLFFFCSAILVCVSVVSSLVFPVIFPWDIFTSFLSALSFSIPNGANGVAGTGFFSALIKYVAAWLAALAEEIPGIVVLSGNNSTGSALCSVLVLEMRIL